MIFLTPVVLVLTRLWREVGSEKPGYADSTGAPGRSQVRSSDLTSTTAQLIRYRVDFVHPCGSRCEHIIPKQRFRRQKNSVVYRRRQTTLYKYAKMPKNGVKNEEHNVQSARKFFVSQNPTSNLQTC